MLPLPLRDALEAHPALARSVFRDRARQFRDPLGLGR
jgi:hypothetical protein